MLPVCRQSGSLDFDDPVPEPKDDAIALPYLLCRLCSLSVDEYAARVAELSRDRSPFHQPGGLQEQVKPHGQL